MLELIGSRLDFSFAEVHPEARCSIEFQRTLRIPDDDKTYPLPPGLGAFPVKLVDDYKEGLSEEMQKKGGVMIPLYQSEALWIRFSAGHVKYQGPYQFAVKIAAGKRSAVTGDAWVQTLKEGDYIVVPKQPWIDGFVVSEGQIRQFVAAPLGMGFTVEEQLTQKAEFGGIQLEVIPMKREEFDKRFPIRLSNLGFRRSKCSCGPAAASGLYDCMPRLCDSDTRSVSVASMGMAAGGKMKQEIYPDPYGLEVWDTNYRSRTFVHLLNSLAWRQITGQPPPHAPQTSKDYNRHGFPWFEYYSDTKGVSGTAETDKIKSVTQIAGEKGFTILPENESSEPQKIHTIKEPPQHQVKDGIW